MRHVRWRRLSILAGRERFLFLKAALCTAPWFNVLRFLDLPGRALQACVLGAATFPRPR